MKHFYGVEKCRGGWWVWQFSLGYESEAVAWLEHSGAGSVRWLCTEATALAMVGESAMNKDNLIVWED